MRRLLIDAPECPDQVIWRERYLATQILNGNWCIVASIQQKSGEANLLMRVQAHRGFLLAKTVTAVTIASSHKMGNKLKRKSKAGVT
ncbi:MAG: hypothetical protein ABIQ44_05820 [Chloroflexia bacterium]